MSLKLRIGTRDSQLARWQADHVRSLLSLQGIDSELVLIKSDGDIDLATPLYDMGVQGIFTRSLDIALLNNQIDLAVHSMKDVPVRLARGIREAAVLERSNPYDVLIPHPRSQAIDMAVHSTCTIASSSLRRRAQWLHRFPEDEIEPIRGNVNTRLKKLESSNWQGAIFAAAGLERIGLRPANAVELSWMVPAPAQGAILVVCREHDDAILAACQPLHHETTAYCVKMEREFLSALHGGCSTPIGALAEISGEDVFFRGNILDPSGKNMIAVEKTISLELASSLGQTAANEILSKGGGELLENKLHV